MCLAVYLGANNILPIIPPNNMDKNVLNSSDWPENIQVFYTATLDENQQLVIKHFTTSNIIYAGSYEGCGCGFNYGREYPDYEDEEDHLRAAKKSIERLVAYIKENNVEEIYSCWFDDEGEPETNQRTIFLYNIEIADFYFRQQELLKIISN